MDNVDKITAQWHKERPDLNVGPMGLIGRLKRLTHNLSREMEKVFAAHGLNSSNFDVLATLRRSGAPYALSPNDLLATMMITSGTMTNRIDQLAKTGYVERKSNPKDRRGFIIALTKKGFDVIDTMLEAHVENQIRLTSCLSTQESQQLNALLSKFLNHFEKGK